MTCGFYCEGTGPVDVPGEAPGADVGGFAYFSVLVSHTVGVGIGIGGM